MTLAAAYLTSEGVVLGADSTTVVQVATQDDDQPRVGQLLDHAQKVFEVGEPGSGRLALCTWGDGSVCGTSHRTVVARLMEAVDDRTTSVEEAVHLLTDIVAKAAADPQDETQPMGFLGYYLGGWDPGSHEPHCFRVEFGSGNDEPKITGLNIGEASFSGSPEYFNRVFRGFDLGLPQMLHDELRGINAELPSSFADDLKRAFENVAQKLLMVGFRDLPIREAIDYVHTYLHITIKGAKFRFGPQLVGGPIEIGFVSTDRRFRWVCHKKHSSAVFEQESGDYE
jgi:hypothetical protein